MDKIFCVYDSKGEYYQKPVLYRTTNDALRAFGMIVNENVKENMIAAHPADFTLFEIGRYDEITGMIVPLEAKINLGTGLDYKNKETH